MISQPLYVWYHIQYSETFCPLYLWHHIHYVWQHNPVCWLEHTRYMCDIMCTTEDITSTLSQQATIFMTSHPLQAWHHTPCIRHHTNCLFVITTSPLISHPLFFLTFLFFFLFLFVVDFVIHWNETAMGLHVFPIPIPPPTSLSTRSL